MGSAAIGVKGLNLGMRRFTDHPVHLSGLRTSSLTLAWRYLTADCLILRNLPMLKWALAMVQAPWIIEPMFKNMRSWGHDLDITKVVRPIF
jgi:hypothetical protein